MNYEQVITKDYKNLPSRRLRSAVAGAAPLQGRIRRWRRRLLAAAAASLGLAVLAGAASWLRGAFAPGPEMAATRPSAQPAVMQITRALQLPPQERTRPRAIAPQPAHAIPTSLAPEAAPGQALSSPAPAEDGGEPPGEPITDPDPGATVTPEAAAPATRHEVVVKRGDSLFGIFQSLGLPQADLQRVLASGDDARRLSRIQPGQKIELFVDDDGSVRRLVYHMDVTHALEVTRDGDTYRSRLVVAEIDRRIASAAGTLDSSLFEAAQKAGLSDNVTMQLADIFGWDVDFALDIRSGDRFSVVYQTLYKDGAKLGDGDILAAEFVNQGRVLRAVRYTDASGHVDYYSPDGHSMRKAFLRTPVKFTRISSRFNLHRRHPILHRIRAHRGVDYAAPRGTPVRATGDGRVVFAGRKGGYGNTVILRHGSIYTTVYAHLSRFRRGIRAGREVRQGQTIGYVGSTGLATGPHLHYEFRVRGVHHDPLTVKLPEAQSVRAEYREDFIKAAKPLLGQLDLMSRTYVAASDD